MCKTGYRARDAQGTRNSTGVPGNDGSASASGTKGKSSASNIPTSSSSEDDDTQAISDLLNAWSQRLQVLTVVTAFLASMDGQLFSLTAVNTQIGVSISRTARELVYSCLAGALIFHICACILAYVASFTLIRYRIVDALIEDGEKVEGIVEGILSSALDATQRARRPSRRVILEPVRPTLPTVLQRPKRLPLVSASDQQPSLAPPLSLLTRCYHTILCLTAAGFILALTGILAYVWAGLRMPVSIFSTVCLGVGVGASVWAIAM